MLVTVQTLFAGGKQSDSVDKMLLDKNAKSDFGGSKGVPDEIETDQNKVGTLNFHMLSI